MPPRFVRRVSSELPLLVTSRGRREIPPISRLKRPLVEVAKGWKYDACGWIRMGLKVVHGVSVYDQVLRLY